MVENGKETKRDMIAEMMPEMSDLWVSDWDPFHCSCRAGEVVT